MYLLGFDRVAYRLGVEAEDTRDDGGLHAEIPEVDVKKTWKKSLGTFKIRYYEWPQQHNFKVHVPHMQTSQLLHHPSLACLMYKIHSKMIKQIQ